jgi:hypothetical protein
MSIAGNTELAVLSIIQAMNSLPSVSMIVIDDWCESGGRIASSDLTQMVKLRDEKKVEATLLLVSKGSIDASGNSKEIIVARSANAMQKAGFTIATLTRTKDGPFRTLKIGDESIDLKLEESGFNSI